MVLSVESMTPAVLQRAALAEELLDAAITSLRQGDLAALIGQHPRATRWMVRRHRPVVVGTAPDAATGAGLEVLAELLIRWSLAGLRPDRKPTLDGIPAEAWTDLVAWRPMLAIGCHARLLDVPDFPSRYRRSAGEAAIENLCGLWDVGPSSVYRYIERARRAIAMAAVQPPGAESRASLRRFVVEHWGPGEVERPAWHRAQSAACRRLGDPMSALWHAVQVPDVDAATAILRESAHDLAATTETELALAQLPIDVVGPVARVELLLAQAAMARTRQEPERELRMLESAVVDARQSDDDGLLGVAYGALGRYYEPRDADRAFAAYEDSVRLLRGASGGREPARLRTALTTSLVRLGWMHVLRNHPRAKDLLTEADALHRRLAIPDDLLGMLEQSWGEYWRVAGDLPRALRARHRALNVFERIGDRRSVLVTYLNLVLLHGEAMEEDKAIEYAKRIFSAARSAVVEPAILVSTHANLGVAHAKAHHYQLAIDAFARALDQAVAADLRLHANRMRLNLASAHYGLFVESREAKHEVLGDQFLDAFLRAPTAETTPSLVATAKGLKAEVLAEMPDRSVDQLRTGEVAEHEVELAEIARHRQEVAIASTADQALRARNQIIAGYLRIADREREAALQWANSNEVSGRALAETERLGRGIGTDLAGRAAGLADRWATTAGHLMNAERRQKTARLLLRDGVLSKSSFARATGWSPASASKHLVELARLGLLERVGRGPATRYRLPPE